MEWELKNKLREVRRMHEVGQITAFMGMGRNVLLSYSREWRDNVIDVGA